MLTDKIKQACQILANMGIRYFSYRLFYELQRKTGLLKRKFPTDGLLRANALAMTKNIIPLTEWKTSAQPFFFSSREAVTFEKKPTDTLKEAFNNILSGKIQFFSYQYFDLGLDYDLVTNPDSGFRYDIRKHWTQINDLSKEAGDIKYVWEKSRFSFLYTIIRYDYHFDEDHSQFVFQQITDWIDKNPLNCGPNYKCSQEISLRILNWIFALYFYKNSPNLTEDLFSKIIQSIYWQLHHVYNNINFSIITVRNNHAITETLTLYIVSALFPQFPNASQWKEKGKNLFEEEIAYQIYDDGTYLQFSMNYHRVVVQLLTWAIRIAGLNGDQFNNIVYEKAYKSLNFLYQCQEDSNGYLPNYGSNDGALFFKLSVNDYRDYRPQLDALHILLTGKPLYQTIYEDRFWYGKENSFRFQLLKKQQGILQFETGGYYLIREPETLTFIRCGRHKDRPAHADNLHLDVWYKGENILVDGGTYKYNTDDESAKYFGGTESHNTVMLDDYDQMLKGPRFVWLNWSQAIKAKVTEYNDYYEFTGEVSCFTYLDPQIIHQRSIRKYKNKPEWEIEDHIKNKPESVFMKQIWHTPDTKILNFISPQPAKVKKSYCSLYYGQKEMIDQIIFYTDIQEGSISTKINVI